MDYHVLNRGAARAQLFHTRADYDAFVSVIEETCARVTCAVLSFCLMPNHWHLVVRPVQSGDLSEFMRLLTVTHAQRWHAYRGTAGTGPVYQGRFKAFPVQSDHHFLTVAKYVERNALRAGLCDRAEAWPWSSLWLRTYGSSKQKALLSKWPVEIPREWPQIVNAAPPDSELQSIRLSVIRGRPFGSKIWVEQKARQFGLDSSLCPPGRPPRH